MAERKNFKIPSTALLGLEKAAIKLVIKKDNPITIKINTMVLLNIPLSAGAHDDFIRSLFLFKEPFLS